MAYLCVWGVRGTLAYWSKNVKVFPTGAYISRGLQLPDFGHCGTFAISCHCDSAGTPGPVLIPLSRTKAWPGPTYQSPRFQPSVDRTKRSHSTLPKACAQVAAATEAHKKASAYHTVRELQFTAVFRRVPQGYIAFVEELPGANTQGATLEEARANLQEAVTLVLEANGTLAQETISGQDVIRETPKVGA